MKRILLPVLSLFVVFNLNAQTVVYHENFEIADSVTATGTPIWGPDNTLQTQGLTSYKNPVATSTQSYLTTSVFSTVGNSFVVFDFDQICKIEFADYASIEVSNDNGNTWNLLTYTEYLGTAPYQALGNRFSSAAYATWLPGNNTAIPTNAWWKHETFDASVFLANSAQCMIRFKLNDQNNNGPNSNYGWVLDKLYVTAAASELFPPVIIQLNPILQGNVYSLGPFAINDSITDASGIASATLHYQINNGPVTNVSMTNPSGNHWMGIIPAVADSDTVCYYVDAVDASPAANTAVLPTSGCTQFVAHAGITFPFFDNFDATTLFTDTAINLTSQWELGIPAYGATNSAHSAPNAWDINLTSPYGSGAGCRLVSPVFDFTSVQGARLSFWHNYNTEGSWDGTRVDYTTDGVTWNVLGFMGDPRGTNWYTTNSLISSNLPGWEGNSSGWFKSEYRLDTLDNVSGPVQFRFVFTSDGSVEIDGYSIDDFLIRTPSPQDGAMVSVIDPDISSCVAQGNIPLTVSVMNDGSQTIYAPFDITYVLDNNTPVTEQFMDSLTPGQIDTFLFVTPLNNTPGTHTLTIYTSVNADGWNLNDTLVVTYITTAGVNVPYLNDFENGPSSLNDFCLINTAQGRVAHSTQAGNASGGGVAFDASNSIDWDFGSDTITSSLFYIWGPNQSDQQRANARLVVNTTGYTDLVLEFDTKLLYAFADEYTNFRVKVNGQMITPHFQPNFQSTPYTQYRYLLTPFLPATSLAIDFESKVAFDVLTGSGVFLDNVHIYHPDSLDAGISQIIQPAPISMSGTPSTVIVAIRNYGTSTLTAIPVAYRIDNNTPVVETWTGNLVPNATATYTFTTTYNAPVGAYNFCTWTELFGDTATWNDTICRGHYGMPVLPLPSVDNFDGPQNFFPVSSSPSTWELGNPLAPLITGTHSGPNAWEIDLDADYQNNCNEYLYTPFYDFSQVTNVEMRFWQWYNADNFYDGGRVEYSTDGGVTWVVLGVQFDPNGVSWYNQGFLQASGLPGWSGNGGGYFQSKYDLSMFNNYPNPIQFRFVFNSDGQLFGSSDGWAIDDFELFVPIDAATSNITFGPPSPLPMPGNNSVKITVRNPGLITLANVSLTLKIDNAVVVTDVLSPNLIPGASITHTFSQQWLGATPGLHTVKCWTSSPNGLADSYLLNDTTTWVISVMDTFATYPYCNNFEVNNGIPPLTTMNAIRFTNSKNSWEQGVPGKNIINSAHAGTQCWLTELTVNYLQNDSAGLFLPVFTVDTSHCYHLEFYTRYLTPANDDGGQVEFSFDMGATWTRLGLGGEVDWYPLYNAVGLGAGYQPNFGGTSNGWVLAQHDIRFSQAGQVIIRFRFGADNSVQSEGWGIDDVCFSQLPPCVLNVPDPINTNGFSMSSTPNPAGTSTVLSYNLPEQGQVNIVLRDMLGQEIAVFAAEQNIGANSWTVDVSTLPNGIYFFELQFGDQKQVQKLVVNH
jgi:Secretion system C-terminal sorting domain